MKILIVGAGDVGMQLSKRLSQDRHDITMIEMEPQQVNRASEQLDAFVLEGSGSSMKMLKTAGIENMEIMAAMTDNDEVNLMACRLAKTIGVPTTISRVRNPEYTEGGFPLTAEEMGADLIIHPEREAADAAIRLIRRSSARHALEFESGKIELLGFRLPRTSPLLHTTLSELGQQMDNLHMRIVAINRNEQTLIPRGNDVLAPDDQVFIVCGQEYAQTFINMVGIKQTNPRDVMVLGGGLIGQFVARSLSREANVKIIEGDENKARKIADSLPNVLIIHGDGTDFDLLENEGLMDMDAFVAVTGDDETNIITTMLAQRQNVSRAIALVNKVDYIPITTTIGLDAVFSKQLLTVNAVQRFIQHQQVASIASLPGIDAQLIEYIASKDSRITKRTLKNIDFPRHAIVGGVLYGDEMLVPHGDTQIRHGDKVIVFALRDAIPQVDKLFRC